MCSKPKMPDVPEVTRYQSSKEPVRPKSAEMRKKGRRSTILTGGQGTTEVSPAAKKTLLGA